MIWVFPESLLANPWVPALALRTEIAIQLLLVVIMLETVILYIVSPRNCV